ncbi:MAG: hypothetical protein K2Y27_28785 [Xanthobacteraceae bacterium]|nr:hypothetical protein [Xanthobacteraceae bacterium]
MSSTEPYPEVSTGDESGIVPPQSNRAPDWPKKIRTLTATELDRLTIDSAGRFYWDGRLVNYEPPQPAKPAEPQTIDRTPVEADPSDYSHEDHKTPAPIEGADLDRPVDGQSQAIAHRDEHLHDLDDVRATRTLHHSAMAGEISDVVATPVVNIPERMRIKMTRWQSLGAIIVVLCALIASAGVAALGLAAAHEWGCRTGVIQSYCPATPAGRPAARTDIPA